ncbi:MAG: tRNA lysidine(34) synthetase TilS, partial [Oscillospiraceae bacterium]
MRDNVLATIRKYGMLAQGDRVTVGLSGGADSVALLRVLLELSAPLGFSVWAGPINQQLRGEESRRDENFCRALCQRLGVPLSVESVDVAGYRAAHPGESVEMAARKLRYDALKAMCKGGKLATAHTASDNTETLLINLARGTGPNGLCGIPPCNGPIVRPLLESTREQVEAYLATLGQDYITDSTNLSDDYTRNRIRHRVAAPLRDMHPTLELAVTRLTEAMWADRAYFDGEVDRAMGRAKRPGA